MIGCETDDSAVYTCLIVVSAAMATEMPNATMKAIRALRARIMWRPLLQATMGESPHPANPVRLPETPMPAPCAYSACMPADPRHAPQAAGNCPRSLERCLTVSCWRRSSERHNLNRSLRDLKAAGTAPLVPISNVLRVVYRQMARNHLILPESSLCFRRRSPLSRRKHSVWNGGPGVRPLGRWDRRPIQRFTPT